MKYTLLVSLICCLVWMCHAEDGYTTEENTSPSDEQEDCELCLRKCHQKMNELADEVKLCETEEPELLFANAHAKERNTALTEELMTAQAALALCISEVAALTP